jgi:dTDP-4-dehydrorhamnose 3,5-epimerase
VRFIATPLEGAFVLEPEKLTDERGFFARVWCADELAARGLCESWLQSSISFNGKTGTLRGMHYQTPPHEETKLVTCTAGAVYDVIVDIRPTSATFREWFGIELAARNNLTLYVPAGVAHGFMTLEDDSVVQYHMSGRHEPGAARAVRWNDPAFGIHWPAEPTVMSDRDRSHPDFEVGR